MTARARRAWLIALFLLALSLALALEYLLPTPVEIADQLTQQASIRLLYAAAAAALCARVGTAGGRHRRPARAAWLVLAAALAVAVNNLPISSLLTGAARVSAPAEAVLALALSCLATAIFEELLFRGFLLPVLLLRLGGGRRGGFLAVLLSSAIFGALHLLNLLGGAAPLPTLLQVGYSFLIGCVAAALVCLFRSLLPAILFHAVYNFCGYLVPQLGSGPLFDTPTVILTVILALACGATVFWALWQHFLPALSKKTEKNTQKCKKI